MGIFDKFFPSDNFNQVGWKVLDSMEGLEEVLNRSHETPVVIFKHSISCGISAMVKDQLFASWDLKPDEVEFYYLDLITYRPVSNAIASRLGVVHQSPQTILIKDGKAVASDSHYSISVNNIKAAV